MEYKVARILLSSEKIRNRVNELGAEIAREYEGKNPILITLLKGGFIFLADLTRAVEIPHEVDFMLIRSYEGKRSTGSVQIVQDLKLNIEGRHVVIVEDIVDTGLTLSYIREHLELRKPASLIVCTLLDKVETRKIEVKVDKVGFPIEDEFVVGYGLDYRQHYRNLPHIAILDPK
ncbi:MAG: hypoxanthine phosphoribosyltransferase [bacterium]|nr:hypoxanthine phosphoribosyltransferase [bacterium]